MNERIVQLIRRDFRAYKKQIIALSIFIMVMSMFVTFVNTNTLRIFTAGIGNIIMIIIGSFAMDQSSSVVRMHTASLPVSRREIVKARFITSLIIVFINTIAHFVIFNILETYIHEEPQYTSTGLFIYALIYGVLQLSVYYFVFYRVNLIIAIIIFVLPSVLWTSISPGAGFMTGNIPENHINLLIFSLVTLGIFVLSYFATNTYYNKKDL